MDFPGIFADRIMPDKIHQLSLSFLVDDLKKNWGGTGGNIAYTLGLLKSKPLLIGTAGNDFAPYKEFLANHGVVVSHIKHYSDIPTGSYFVITDRQDNQIGAFYTGAMRYAGDLALEGIIKPDDLVLIAPNDPTAMRKYVAECQQKKVPYMYDPAFQIGVFTPEELLKAIDSAGILIGNDYEIELITQKLSINKTNLLTHVPMIITTLGNQGAQIECQGEATIPIAPAKPAAVVDPTGAGDAFRAGFLAGYARGFDLQTCGQMGAVAAVYTVELYGTTTHRFTVPEFVQRYQDNYRTELKFLDD
jgi:adenosine kinase